MKVAIVGAGWAGCAAAVHATRLGHQVTLFEATRIPGGRAKRVDINHGSVPLRLDNGQHILIGAYSETLKLMAQVGINEGDALLRIPLTMQFPNGIGLKLAHLPAPLDAAVGIMTARGWSIRDKASLLVTAAQWKLRKFECSPQATVASLCARLTPPVMATLIEPLCVSALNTPADRASGQVFLRVMRDALFSASDGSNLLLPRVDLSALLPDAAMAWLAINGAEVQLGSRVQRITQSGAGWQVSLGTNPVSSDLYGFDAIILACPVQVAVKLVQTSALPCAAWLNSANDLTHEAITTVYAFSRSGPLAQPMLALRSSSTCPAQFVFDRSQLGGPAGLLAFVVSASTGDSATLSSQVVAQAAAQLGLPNLEIVQTIVEKRATFACTPGLVRPSQTIAQGLLAAGDYVEGPYPATLEGAVRSGIKAALLLK
jgi:hydroxysqualene dehydroxylase